MSPAQEKAIPSIISALFQLLMKRLVASSAAAENKQTGWFQLIYFT